MLLNRVIYLISNIASMGSKPDMMYIAGSGALVGRDSICLSIHSRVNPVPKLEEEEEEVYFFGIPLVSLD